MSRNEQPDAEEAPPSGRREANKREKLLRIRRAARDVFLEKGYEDATLREIAVAADVAFGTLFLYAKNKKDLLLLLFDTELPSVTERAFEQATVEGSLMDQLIAFFGELYAFFAQTPALSRDMMREFTFTGGIVAPRLREEVLVIEGHLARLVARAQENGRVTPHIAPGLAAHVFFSLHQVEIRFCLDSPEPDVAGSLANLRRQLELVFAGLTPSRSQNGGEPASAAPTVPLRARRS
jgi:AcrR family transcriptional regulator